MRLILAGAATFLLSGCISMALPPFPPQMNVDAGKFVEGPHSERCTAVAENITTTLFGVNDDPIMSYTLRVTPPGGGPYEATITALTPHLFVPRLGDTLDVACDPGAPANTRIIWRDGVW
jgi:hypothetical protein